jgi:hypothetical protein
LKDIVSFSSRISELVHFPTAEIRVLVLEAAAVLKAFRLVGKYHHHYHRLVVEGQGEVPVRTFQQGQRGERRSRPFDEETV